MPDRTRSPTLSIVAALLGVSMLAGCADEAAVERLVLANVHAEPYPTAMGLRALEQSVAADEALAGFEIDLRLGGVLGGEKEVLEKVGFGAVDLYAGSIAPLAEFSSEIGVLSLPYLFNDADHFWAVLDGQIGEELLASLADAGFVGLAFYDAGARSFYNRRRPVAVLDDLEGLKIRVQRSDLMRSTVEALGAVPVALGFKQVYTSLQTGAIDGAENNLPSYRSERHFEVAPYYSRDEHSRIPDVVVIRRAVWDDLTEAERSGLLAAARASSRTQRELWAEAEREAREAVEAAGAEVVDVGDPQAFRRAVEPVYDEHGGAWSAWIERVRAVGPE